MPRRTPGRKPWDISEAINGTTAIHHLLKKFRRSKKAGVGSFFFGRKFFPMDSEFPTQKVFLVQHQVEHDAKHISLSS